MPDKVLTFTVNTAPVERGVVEVRPLAQGIVLVDERPCMADIAMETNSGRPARFLITLKTVMNPMGIVREVEVTDLLEQFAIAYFATHIEDAPLARPK